MVKAPVRRAVAGHLQAAYDVGERRACRATGFGRSSQRCRKRSDPQAALRMRPKELAAARVRYGDRRLHILVRREGWEVNHNAPTVSAGTRDRRSGPSCPSASVLGATDKDGRP